MAQPVATTWRTSPVRLAWWLRAILFAAPLAGAVFIPGEFAKPDGSPGSLLLVTLFMVICMWPLACAAHWIEGDADGMRIRYVPLLSRRLEFTDLASVDYRSQVSPWMYGGIGLRLAVGGVLAFVNRRGPGVGVRLTDGRAYFVVLRDDQELGQVRRQLAQARPDLVP